MLTLVSSTIVRETFGDRVVSIEHKVVLADETGKTVTILLPANGDPAIGSVFEDSGRVYGLSFAVDGHYY